MTFEHPVRFPPPLSRSKVVDGKRVPIMQPPVIECGQKVELRGIGWVVCIREAGHPVYLDWGHTNGYTEWCFDADSGNRPTDKENRMDAESDAETRERLLRQLDALRDLRQFSGAENVALNDIAAYLAADEN